MICRGHLWQQKPLQGQNDVRLVKEITHAVGVA
jgi:hypothetical protein